MADRGSNEFVKDFADDFDQSTATRNGGDVAEADESNNPLYALLDANEMSSASSLLSNIRDVSAPMNTFGFSEAEDSGFQNASSVLGESEFLSGSGDVYRCVTAVDFATQHQMGLGAESALDQPFSVQTSSLLASENGLGRPSPRALARLRLEHTHMYVACPLSLLVERMDTELRKYQVDSMFEDSGCFWRGMFYPTEPSMAVDFRIYLNSCPTLGTDRFLVEFVRREGCSMAFNQLFSKLQASFLEQDMVTKPDGDFVSSIAELPSPFKAEDIAWENKFASEESSSSDSLPRPLLSRSTSVTTNTTVDDESDFDSDLELRCSDEDLFQPLYAMSKSEFEDVHVQGLSLVVHEAKRGNAERMLNTCPAIVEILVERLGSSGHSEVRRNACTALCEFAKTPETHEAIIRAGSLKFLAEVASSPLKPATVETQRQAAGALANLCSNKDSVQAVFEAVQDKVAVFEELANCEDSRLTQSIQDVHRALEAF